MFGGLPPVGSGSDLFLVPFVCKAREARAAGSLSLPLPLLLLPFLVEFDVCIALHVEGEGDQDVADDGGDDANETAPVLVVPPRWPQVSQEAIV